MAVRCKFVCQRITQFHGWSGSGQQVLYGAEFSPVTTGTEEDKAFWAATPGGKLELHTIKAMPFEVGKAYYLEITPAEP